MKDKKRETINYLPFGADFGSLVFLVLTLSAALTSRLFGFLVSTFLGPISE